MKVATKFALAFFACGVLSVLVYSWVAAAHEVERLEQTVAEDLASLGRSLSRPVMAVWERDGEQRALELVDYHDRDPTIDARWIWLDLPPGHPSGPKGGGDVLSALRRGKQQTWVDGTSRGARLLYAYIPMERPGHRPAALELSRPLLSESQIFWSEVRAELVFSTLVAAFALVLALTLTRWIVSRPLARAAEQARRIGEGDLSHRLAERGSDEVAALVRDLNVMCDQIRIARDRADAEAQRRIATLEQLRHADRLRTVGTLASGIAHELGTPLSVIAMRAKMIASGEASGDEAPENARIIAAQAERVTKIVRQLLDFARRRSPKRADVDLGELAVRTGTLLSAIATKSNVTIAVERDGEVRANVDAAQIEQALTNLVINAVHAMPEGGTVTIRVRTGAAIPRAGHADPRPCAILEVADQGIGIAEQDHERVFEPFFTTKSVGDGTGLGLSVTHGIIEDHGGWMTVDSEAGKGATFAVYLPV
jgi:signal transduction histidine kinase